MNYEVTFQALIEELKAIKGVQVAEYEWKTRPAGDYATARMEFEADSLNGDDQKLYRAMEGSVDLFMHGKDMVKVAAVESALETVCMGCWKLESNQYERETGLVHYEWSFQIDD